MVTVTQGEKPGETVITITGEPTFEVLDDEEILPSLSICHYTPKEVEKFLVDDSAKELYIFSGK